MSQEDSSLQNDWICPKCFVQNQNSALECECGLTINKDDLAEYSGSITSQALYQEIDNYSFIDAERKVFILSYYLIKRFPESDEAQKLRKSLDITSQDTTDKFLKLLDSYVQKREIICGKCGTTNVYNKQTQQCAKCGDWLYQYMSSTDEDSDEENSSEREYDTSSIRCPKCRSTQMTAQKQGFGLGKAAVGGVLAGGIGLLGGFIRSRKVYLTCLKCGHKFKPGS